MVFFLFSPNQTEIYQVEYVYDAAGRLKDVIEPPLPGGNDYIAQFQYDKNGNRSQLKYFHDGSKTGNTTSIGYTYNLDNMLVGFATTGGPTFTLNNVALDGLGRLKGADETITKADAGTISHSYIFAYDMRSQLTDASISNINGGNWVAKYSYHNNGDMAYRIIQSDSQSFSYNGHLMTTADGNPLDYDENGNMIENASAKSLKYNWDNKLRCAKSGNDTLLAVRYDPAGNRIYKETNNGSTKRKYIVDIVGDLPVILMVLDDSQNVLKKYIYANSQIVAQHDVSDNNKLYFYLHDRLGSVRQMIDTTGAVVVMYTYEPFGKIIEQNGSFANPFKFSGQFFDDEIGQYYLRARQYDPYISRFTSRDPVFGQFQEPMTLHAYLYCINNPIDRIDPAGLWGTEIHNQIIDEAFTESVFTGLSSNERGYIARGSEYVDDEYSAKEFSFMHAMREGRYFGRNQSVEEAKRLMQGFIYEHLFAYEEFKSYGSSAYREFALFNLGMALHPVMDLTSPAHEGFQPWFGYSDIGGASAHGYLELKISPETRQSTVTLMKKEITSFEKVYPLIKESDWYWTWGLNSY